jgi:hypothetical protein
VKRQLESQIDDLYRLPLGEFTKGRNALAKTLSGDDKKQIASLVKPSLPMWVINQLRWEDAATYDALIDASEKLRSAHRAALSGRKVDTRKSEALHRTTVEKAFAKAASIAEKREGRLTGAVRDAIRRTLAALPGDEQAGRLTREPPAAGFSLLTGVAPQPRRDEEGKPQRHEGIKPRLEGHEDRRSRKRELEEQRRLKLADKQRREAERKAQQEEAKARKAQEKREREIRKAEQALRDAERRLAALKS